MIRVPAAAAAAACVRGAPLLAAAWTAAATVAAAATTGLPPAAPRSRCSRCAATAAAAGASWRQRNPLDDGRALVLGIESSCDDTAAAVVSAADGSVLGEAIAGQADLHAAYGGVHPAAASRAHAAAIDRVVAEALAAAGLPSAASLAAVAVTVGPGLSLCLDVGVRKARALSREAGLPLVPVHHMEAHALIARMPAAAAAAGAASGGGPASSSGPSSSAGGGGHVAFPFLCLLVSGGHNLLVLVRGVGDYLQLGSTLDDALGEAYDKVARMLGLELRPHGGAALEALARRGDPAAFPLPVPMRKHANCDFSFAGLKTGVRLCIEKELPPPGDKARERVAADIAASFQAVAAGHLCQRVARGIEWARGALDAEAAAAAAAASSSSSSSSSSNGGSGSGSGSGSSGGSGGNGGSAALPQGSAALRQLVVAGGVASNQYIRQRLREVAAAAGLELVVPPPRWCTDNGVMVAWAGVERLRLGLFEPPLGPPVLKPGEAQEWVELRPRWPLTSEKHASSMPQVRSSKAASSLARSLTDETRDALAAKAAREAAAGEAGSPPGQAAAAATAAV